MKNQMLGAARHRPGSRYRDQRSRSRDAEVLQRAQKPNYVRKEQVFLSQIVISTEGKTPSRSPRPRRRPRTWWRAPEGRKVQRPGARQFRRSGDREERRPVPPYQRGSWTRRSKTWSSRRRRATSAIPSRCRQGFLILKVDERFEAGQASFRGSEGRDSGRLAQPKMEPKVRVFLTRCARTRSSKSRTATWIAAPRPARTPAGRTWPVEAADHHQGRSGRAPSATRSSS